MTPAVTARRRIEPADLVLRPFHVLDERWALLVAGAPRPNPMTVSWGGLGTLWNRPVVTVFVRPTRYTFELLAAHAEFTLNVLPEERRRALDICGTKSGRDLDKWQAAGLEPLASEAIGVPCVAGSELSFECRVLATTDLDPARFLDPAIHRLYPAHDHHRVYFAEVVRAWAGPGFAPAG